MEQGGWASQGGGWSRQAHPGGPDPQPTAPQVLQWPGLSQGTWGQAANTCRF